MRFLQALQIMKKRNYKYLKDEFSRKRQKDNEKKIRLHN